MLELLPRQGAFLFFYFFYLCFEWRGGDPYVTLQNFSMKVTFAFFSLEKPVNIIKKEN